MNKENQLEKFKSITNYNIEVIYCNGLKLEESFDIHIFDNVIQLKNIILATVHFTDITIQEINEYLNKEINMSYDDLLAFEASSY